MTEPKFTKGPGHFIAALNDKGEVRAMMRADDAPSIHNVIETLQSWAETDPERRIVLTDAVASATGEA